MRRIIAAMLAVLAPGVAWGQQGTPTFQTLTTTGNAAVGGTLSAISLPTNPMTLGSPPATLNGVADDSAGVQAARNTITTDGRIYVPNGTLNVVTPPTKPAGSFAIWDITAATPSGFNAFNESFGSDVVHAINQGEWWYQRKTSATSGEGVGPMFRIDRKVTHTGGGGWAQVQINDVWDAASAPGGQMTTLNVNTTLNATSGGSPAVGIYQKMIRTASSVTPGFGLNFSIEDQTGANHNFAFIGSEWDIIGNGTWANNQAGVQDVVLKKSQSGGSTFQANFGVRVGNWTADLTQGGYATPFLVGATNIYTAGFSGPASTPAAGVAMFDGSGANYTDTVGIAFRTGPGNAIDFGAAGATHWLRWSVASSFWNFGSGNVGTNWSLDANGFNSIPSAAITGAHNNIALSVTSTTVVGMDLSGATLSGNAVRLAANQTIALEGTGSVTVRYDSSTTKTKIAVGGVDTFSVDASGNVKAKGTITPMYHAVIRAALIATALSLLSLWVHAAQAQQPQSPSASAQFAGQLATMLTDTIAERDTARVALSACQAASAKPATPAQPEAKP